MSDLDDFPTDSIKVIRIPAAFDLGEVHQGDYLVVIPGRGVVAVDTRRIVPETIPETVWRESPVKPAKLTKPAKPPASVDELKRITQDRIIAVIKKHGTTTTMVIADELQINRRDQRMRDRVKRVMRTLREANIIEIRGHTRRNYTQYTLVGSPQPPDHSALDQPIALEPGRTEV